MTSAIGQDLRSTTQQEGWMEKYHIWLCPNASTGEWHLTMMTVILHVWQRLQQQHNACVNETIRPGFSLTPLYRSTVRLIETLSSHRKTTKRSGLRQCRSRFTQFREIFSTFYDYRQSHIRPSRQDELSRHRRSTSHLVFWAVKDWLKYAL